VQPGVLIPNNTRTIISLRATRDYRADNTQVKVAYEGGYSEKFTTTVVSPNRNVAIEIATRLDRPLAQVTDKIRYDSIYGSDFKSILLTIYTDNLMILDIEYKDGKTERRNVTPDNVLLFVAVAYSGDYAAYQSDLTYYVERARRGESIEKVYELVAGALATTKEKVRNILKIDVEQYREECTTYTCGGS
jgi:hypothetical protein